MCTISRMSVFPLRTVSPRSRTVCGSCGNTDWIRFCTSTCAMSTFVSFLNVTVIVMRPSLVDEEDMYSMLVMPLICCSSGAATVSAISSAVAPGYSALTDTVGGAIAGY